MRSPLPVLMAFAMREALRRRVFGVVGLLTVGYLALYWFGTREAFQAIARNTESGGQGQVDSHELAGATLTGLAMFAVLFLGSVLAVFLAVSTVRGDAEAGLLQPLVTRPLGRGTVVVARAVAAAAVSAAYVVVVELLSVLVVRLNGDWSPPTLGAPVGRLAAAVAVVAMLCVLGSTLLTTTANGIATFMLFGAGLFAGLLGQVGTGLGNERLQTIARITSWALPFEALYQDGLASLSRRSTGVTHFLVQLGPFGGGSPASGWLLPYVAGYLVLGTALAVLVTRRRDL